jgi:glycosyltransferase involved in cell wall biosynthesis
MLFTTTSKDKKLKVVYLTNIPAPYRERMHEILASCVSMDYTVFYCSEFEPNRKWEFTKGEYEKVYLSHEKNKMVHNNSNVVKYLNHYNPDVVISSGFNPTMIYSFAWCVARGKKYIPFTDGTFNSEQELSGVHRLVRRVVFKYSSSFIGASKGSAQLYESYHIPREKIFQSCLCVDNSSFMNDLKYKKYDLMFSGQLIDRKMPLFFAEVAKKVRERTGQCHVLILGDGPLRNELLKALLRFGVTFDYEGFVQPSRLPQYYCQSKLFLFPTLNDPWGIVANEACASGLPVITCNNAGVANDLVIHGYNGYIFPLEVDVWADHICYLLAHPSKLTLLSENALKQVKNYNYQSSVHGILKSVNYAMKAAALPLNISGAILKRS